jgi:hypothetical protein
MDGKAENPLARFLRISTKQGMKKLINIEQQLGYNTGLFFFIGCDTLVQVV